MNIFNRFFGTIFSPQQTAKALSEKPVWLDALIILLVLTALFSYFMLPYQLEDSYNMMKDNVQMRERLGDRFDEYLERMENPPKSTMFVRPFVVNPISLLFFFMIQSLIIFGLSRLVSTEGTLKQVWSVFFHARIIDVVLGGGLHLILVLVKKSSFDVTLSLAMFFPKMDILSTPYLILSQFSFFQIWAFGILGIGLAQVLKIELKKGLFISYGFFFLKCVFHIGIGLLGQMIVR
jgi:hypothetical protein